ncbi:MAG: glycosyltransferase family 4 protein [Actinomyces sp.]|jgi:phosphatidylinositol alpha-mannosyltransferase|nr:glycosyltransferase family 4 protein [Actinomyces sp.]MCI1641062.1 glycosyltransferase family 4 protein [Actinomyces sp.]MCI1661430.1 glycosyltransferase family 4 protein [Actinomyces sp.]MCI1690438.1 glycosyltransferase family 4 protein [Actinomyces sp.]MCI1787079.1 glycosyltransferase family 4 protein [Actinomyces sp.]MCI1829355.1 glycosyltransferase family 4 protein [Actinomyces sp.]
MRIGIVCPYSWDVPGGVQFHIRDLAGELIRRGHEVSVLTPSEHADLPDFATSVGAAVPIPFNGSVARLSFGPLVSARTRRWLDEGGFDVLHVHEPTTPSISMLAVMNADVPVVATFHSSMDRSYAREMTAGVLRPLMERISVRIAVSAEARRTLIEHHGGDAVIIPNGVETRAFREAAPRSEWEQTAERPVIAFLGRLDEPRKGLSVFAEALPTVLDAHPGARFLIAGRGGAEEIRQRLSVHGDSVRFLGEVTDADKQSLLRGATVYVAPQTGGESFGIVLVEAMSAGCAVVASELAAFRAVLADGRAGLLFPTGDARALSDTLIGALDDRARLAEIARIGQREAAQYDWGVVTDRILAVYQAAEGTARPGDHGGSALDLLRGRLRGEGQ